MTASLLVLSQTRNHLLGGARMKRQLLLRSRCHGGGMRTLPNGTSSVYLAMANRLCANQQVAVATLSTSTTSSSSSSSGFSQLALDHVKKLIQERKDNEANPNRPQTSWERVKNFPEGVKGLVRDYFRCQAIQETPLNQWTIEYPTSTSQGCDSNTTTATRTIQLNRIPRRQYEQQRQLRNDVGTVAPLLILWTIPMIGAIIPPIVATAAPRQLLSRHFHNPYEVEWFAQMEYEQRLEVYEEVVDMLLLGSASSPQKVHPNDLQALVTGVGDTAGPMLDAATLYKTFFVNDSSIHDLPREQLVKLSLAMGINQHLPGWLSPWVAEFQPAAWHQRQVDRMSRVICMDDAMLIEEGHHLVGCSTLTYDEVMEACRMRGLPVKRMSSTSAIAEERRRCLTNHLTMIAVVREDLSLTKQVDTSDGLRLLTVYLTPIRHALVSKKKNLQL